MNFFLNLAASGANVGLLHLWEHFLSAAYNVSFFSSGACGRPIVNTTDQDPDTLYIDLTASHIRGALALYMYRIAEGLLAGIFFLVSSVTLLLFIGEYGRGSASLSLL